MRDGLCSESSAFFFRSQSLDDESPDHVQISGKCVVDTLDRRKLAQNIDEVARNGRPLHDGQSSRSVGSDVAAPVFHNDRFTLRIRVEELDDAGRQTAIVCYGRVPRKPPMDWPCCAVTEMHAFADRIGRTISYETQEEARRGLEMILKTHGSLKNKAMRVIALVQQWIRRLRSGT